MPDAAQKMGLARVCRSVTSAMSNAGEPEVVTALAVILTLGALMIGLCRGGCRQSEKTVLFERGSPFCRT